MVPGAARPDDSERERLYSRLQEVLGTDPAATLMALLPGTGDAATRSDLEEVTALVERRHSELEAELQVFRAEMKEELREIRRQMQSNFRTFVVAQTSTVLAVAGLVLAYDRLF